MRETFDDVISKAHIALEAINGFLDSMECLAVSETPVVFVEKEPRGFCSGTFIGGEKQRESNAPTCPVCAARRKAKAAAQKRWRAKSVD